MTVSGSVEGHAESGKSLASCGAGFKAPMRECLPINLAAGVESGPEASAAQRGGRRRCSPSGSCERSEPPLINPF